MLIFVTHGKGACRTCCEDNSVLLCCLTNRVNVHFSLLSRLITESVSNQCHATTFLFLQQVDTITYCVHNLYKVFAQLWEVIIDVTAVEVAYVFLKTVLLFGCIALVPCLKLLTAIGWETTMFVNTHHTVEHCFDRLQSQGGVDNRCNHIRHRTHEVGICQHSITQNRSVCTVFDA